MTKQPWDWDESDLKKLIDQPENYRLEFKDDRLLLEQSDKIINDLTKAVSAFANTEGGVIVIGLREKTVPGSKAKVADSLHGVELSKMIPESLQRMVEGHLMPRLLGMRFNPVLLAGTSPAKYAYVIYIPKGSNAYQARDKKYYGRSEYESNALDDNYIRLLMSRGRTMQGTIVLQKPQARIAEKVYQDQVNSKISQVQNSYRDITSSLQRQIDKQIAEEQAQVKKELYDEYTFGLELKNVGELTIKECYLTIEFLFNNQNIPDGQPQALAQKHEGQTKSHFAKDSFTFSSEESNFKNKTSSIFIPEKKIYPGRSTRFPEPGFLLSIPEGKPLTDFEPKLKWTLYYDDSPPNSGEIDLAKEFSNIF